jgi:hypothetical protein
MKNKQKPKYLGLLNVGRINFNLYVCGMYLTQCETILSKNSNVFISFQNVKNTLRKHSTFNYVVNLKKKKYNQILSWLVYM